MKFTTDELIRLGYDPETGLKSEKKKVRNKKNTPIINAGQVPGLSFGIWIPGNVPSQKNSQNFSIARDEFGVEITKENGKKLTKVKKSKPVQNYIKTTLPIYINKSQRFRELVQGYTPPYVVYYKIIRGNKGIFDYNNASHVITDLMKKAGWVEDDNADNLIFIPIRAGYNPKTPGVFIIA